MLAVLETEAPAAKTCTKCHQEKPLSLFSLQRYRHRPAHYRGKCRSCRVEDQRRWREANPEIAALRNRVYAKRNPKSQRPKHLRRRYDLEIAAYQEMVARQGGACAICRTVADDPWNMQVDHCHETGRVRGLLCHKCNKGIGLLGDNPDLLRAAVRYLEVE